MHSGLYRILGMDPMQSGFYPSTIWCVTTFRLWIVRTVEFHRIALVIFEYFLAGYKICVTQAHFPARRQAKEFFGRVLHKIILLNIKFRPKLISLIPAAASSGLLTAANVSVASAG